MRNFSSLVLLPFLTYVPLAHSALLDLADAPLFLGVNVDPNVFFEIDDSGSMDWSVLSKPYWHHCSYDPNATGSYSTNTLCGWWVTNGLIRSNGNGAFRDFTYMWENDGNVYSDQCSSSNRNSISACTVAGDREWRLFSSDLNLTYYNPDLSYKPWFGPCNASGTPCSDANFTWARSNPRDGESGYSSTRNLNGSHYNVWIDNKGFDTDDGRPLRAASVNHTNTPNGEIDLWDSHIEFTMNSGSIDIRQIDFAPTTLTMGRTSNLIANLTNSSACYNILGPKELVQQVFNGSLSATSKDAPGCRTIDEVKQNYANWYQYNRKRSFIVKGAISEVIKQYPNFRYGLSVINAYGSLFKEVPPASTTNYISHNYDLINSLYTYNWAAYGTPLRYGLNRTGQYFDGTLSGKTDPIINACQQNFTILFTDGFWNGSTPSGIGDVDGDGIASTVADIAKYYYDKDLSAFPNDVLPNPFDPATYQHMVTYTVAFGVSGNLADTDGDGWPNPTLAENGNWGDPYNNNPAKIDDLWHAAFNAKGTFIAAQSPKAITDGLGNALSNITNRIASAATVAQNSSTLNTNSQVYQARFDSNSWKGELLAYPIDLNGILSTTPSWNASCKLTGGDCTLPPMDASQNPGKSPSQRVIITRSFNGNNSGTPFSFPSNYDSLKVSGALPDALYNLLKYAPNDPNTKGKSKISQNQDFGDKLVAYLRGDKNQEQQNNGTYNFRNRHSLLGDIINSSPLYVGIPDRFFPDTFEATPYATFKSTYANRTPMIYVGANDGMLHGFRADTGEEMFAYVPGDRNLYESLAEYAQSNYQHKYMVDGMPDEADVYINSAWKTVLAGALQTGGQTVFALDVTDPSTFTEANANNIYLWEFSDKDDPDLGFVSGQVKIAKVRTSATTSKWAVIFGNGYNNSASDGYASTTGKAALFILFIEQGLDGNWTVDTDYIKIPVGTGSVSTPNGLSEPYIVDIDGDYIVDYVYAGDLKGMLWKFDLTLNTPTDWKTSATGFFQSYATTPGDQPITSVPVVSAHPTGLSNGVMIYFGTGKFIENSDNNANNAITQTFYGLWDKLDGSTYAKTDLLQQAILAEHNISVDTDGDGANDSTVELRRVSDYSINWEAPSQAGDPVQHRGWYMNLYVQGAASNNGERAISRPLVRNGNVIFTTLLPSASPCDFGGSSWLMELDMETGGQPEDTPFDVNNDGVFDKLDYINVGDIDNDGNDDYVPSGGRKSDVGITPTPAVFVSGDKSKETKVTSGSKGLDTIQENINSSPMGRQNWKQISR